MRTTLLLLLLLSPGCATTSYAPEEYQQAAPAYRPAPRPPAVTPGYRPNTPPPPEYAPEGAGASHGGIVTTPEGKTVPRSPYKRVLPASKEPGLWAADGAPRASAASVGFFGLSLPYPPPVAGPGTRHLMDRCIDSVTDAAEQVGKLAIVTKFPESVRKCMAGAYLFACGHDETLKLGEASSSAAPATMEEFEAAANLQEYGSRLRDAFCPRAGTTPEQQRVFDAILNRWMSNERDRKTSRSTH